MRRFMLFTWLLLSCGVTVEAATRYASVGGSQGSPCTTAPPASGCPLNTAITAAASGDTVQLAAGTYAQNVNIASKTNIILDGKGVAKITNTSGTCIDVQSSSSNITIQSLEIGVCQSSGTGHGINLRNCSGCKVYDSYIHTEQQMTNDSNDHRGITVQGGGDNIEIQGNVITFGGSNIDINCNNTPVCDHIAVRGNYSMNVLGNRIGDGVHAGNHIMSHGNIQDGTTHNTFMVIDQNFIENLPGQPFTSRPEDNISSTGEDGTQITNNYIRSPGAIGTSPTGCAIIHEQYSRNNTVSGNIVDDGVAVGICIASGTNNLVTNNKIQVETAPALSSGVGIYANNYGDPAPCNNNSITNNITATKDPADGAFRYQITPETNCDPTFVSGNTVGAAARAILNPIGTTNPPPLKPPVPKNCTAVSPYTTQTSLPSCAATAMAGVTLTATSPVVSGASSLLTYGPVTGATSCTPSIFSGQADATWTGRSSAALITGATNQAQGARTSLTTYRLSCTDGTTTTNADATVGVTPAIPTGFTASGPTVSTINGAWTANSPTDLAGYEVLVCNATAVPGCTPSVSAGTVGLVTSGVARGLLGNTSYRLALRAFNTTNNFSALSTVQTSTTLTIPAGSPELLVTFEAGTGTQVFDSSGHGHNSSVSTGTFSASVPTGGGSFSGSYNGAQETRIPRISGSGAAGFEPTGPTAVSLAAWVRRTGTQLASSTIAGKTWGNSTGPSFTSYKMVINPASAGTDFVGCEIGFGVSPNVATLASLAMALPDATWTHVSCTYDPSAVAPQWKLYVNGALTLGNSATRTDTLVYDATTAGDFYLSGTGSGVERMNGLVDEVRMYPRALTLAEVAQLAGVGDTTPPAPPTNLRVVSP